MEQFQAFFGVLFAVNFTLALVLGLPPFPGVFPRRSAPLAAGAAAILVLAALAAIGRLLLECARGLWKLDGIWQVGAFIAAIVALTQLAEMLAEKRAPGLHRTMGLGLPLLAVNCAILGLAASDASAARAALGAPAAAPGMAGIALTAALQGAGGGAGVSLGAYLAGVFREDLEGAPKATFLDGYPAAFAIAAGTALALLGLYGIL